MGNRQKIMTKKILDNTKQYRKNRMPNRKVEISW